MSISKEQFLALTPGKHEVVIGSCSCYPNESNWDARISVVDNQINYEFSGVPGEREVVLAGPGGTKISYGWDNELNLIVQEWSMPNDLLNDPHTHVVEI